MSDRRCLKGWYGGTSTMAVNKMRNRKPELLGRSFRFPGLELGFEKIRHRFREWREILRRATGNQIAIDDHRFISPDGASIFEVVADSTRTGGAAALENFGGYRNPAAVADER